MISIIKSGVVMGIDAFQVNIEADISNGLPAFNIVGLPENAVRESRERVRAAIRNSGYSFPSKRITINLAPADIRKEGTGLDLPIAAALLSSTGLINADRAGRFHVTGELSLDGTVKPVTGILPMAIAHKNWDSSALIAPAENAAEGSIVPDSAVIPVHSLSELVEFLNGHIEIMPHQTDISGMFNKENEDCPDFSDVTGQEQAKRALEIAAAGSHNVLMSGPPGSGKTMLARRLPSIMPEMTFDEAIETTVIYSVAGLLDKKSPLMTQRPFCAPHHTISDAGLTGGGSIPKPGQVSLAHNGILFLDELPEFRRNVLENLRQPIENGFITISRASVSLTFPCSFTLVAARNPCPCGYAGSNQRECVCSRAQIERYRNRISGPLLDRLDINIDVPAVPYRELTASRKTTPSHEIRKRVIEARKIQTDRFRGTGIYSNAKMDAAEISRYCAVGSEEKAFLNRVMEKINISARSYHRILKIARTIADLEGQTSINTTHLSEAVQYRTLDRNMD